MQLIVQTLITKWTKRSRGAPFSTRRNATPELLELPHGLVGDWQHIVRFYEHNDFEPSAHTVELESREFGFGFKTKEFEDALRVTFDWTKDVGAPERNRAFAFELNPGEVGRLVFNGRLSEGWDAYWTYHKVVHNIGWFEDEVKWGTCDAEFRVMAELK